jgi:hypothetical protein
MDQHREAGGAFHQRADRGALETDDEVSLPVPRNRTVLSFGWARADQDRIGDMPSRLLPIPSTGYAQRPTGAKTRHQLPLERTPAFDVERLVDRLMADPHRLIIGELDLEAVRDLLRTPRVHPAAVTTMRFVPSFPDWPCGAQKPQPRPLSRVLSP